MALNEGLADRISTALIDVKNVELKMMFSGVAFMVNGKMCINVTRDGLMCRVDPKVHETLVEKPGCSSMVMKGRELKGWVLVSEEVIKSENELVYWISLCLSFNKEARSSKKKRKRGGNEKDETYSIKQPFGS